MDQLKTSRDRIEQIDKEIAALFEERMTMAGSIAKYKMDYGMQVFDASREKFLLDRNVNYIQDVEIKPYYLQFLQSVMDISKRYQHKVIEGSKIAYSGIEGAFANIATRRIFPDGTPMSFKNFRDAYDAVVNGECEQAVLPIENSYAGEVGQVMDLMFEGDLYINGIYSLEISQNLLGVEGAGLSDIRRVISHPQALSQCEVYTTEHGFETQQAVNTAVAAKQVAELNDKSVAAIASRETAELYGLKVIDHDINKDRQNTTKFAVVSKIRESVLNRENQSTFILMFTVKNEAGSLADAIAVIGKYGFSMNVLRSRPLKGLSWQYYFYVEIAGNAGSLEGDKMLAELKEHCETLKFLGSYAVNASI